MAENTTPNVFIDHIERENIEKGYQKALADVYRHLGYQVKGKPLTLLMVGSLIDEAMADALKNGREEVKKNVREALDVLTAELG